MFGLTGYAQLFLAPVLQKYKYFFSQSKQAAVGACLLTLKMYQYYKQQVT